MSPLAIASVVFVLVLASGLIGLSLRRVLPEHHLSEDSMNMVKLGTGLIATLAALVLGLLIASAKGYYDKVSDEVTQSAAKVVLLDRTLARYGPETKASRDQLRNIFAAATQMVFAQEGTLANRLDAPERQARVEQFEQELQQLAPRTDVQRALQSRAVDLTNDLVQMRWLAIEQTAGSIPVPLLAVLVLWLAVIFAGFGIVSAKNATVVVVFLLCAFSVAGSIFLIEEMDRPFSGLMRISRASMNNALSHLGQ